MSSHAVQTSQCFLQLLTGYFLKVWNSRSLTTPADHLGTCQLDPEVWRVGSSQKRKLFQMCPDSFACMCVSAIYPCLLVPFFRMHWKSNNHVPACVFTCVFRFTSPECVSACGPHPPPVQQMPPQPDPIYLLSCSLFSLCTFPGQGSNHKSIPIHYPIVGPYCILYYFLWI